MKTKRIERTRRVGIGESHPQGIPRLGFDDGEFGVHGEAVLRHGTNVAASITPEFVFAIDVMACNEGKKDGIAAAHLPVTVPIGVRRPGNDLAAGLLPPENACAVIGADQDLVLVVGDFVCRLVLEKEGAFHVRMRYACGNDHGRAQKHSECKSHCRCLRGLYEANPGPLREFPGWPAGSPARYGPMSMRSTPLPGMPMTSPTKAMPAAQKWRVRAM